jgi:anhydro-N-acetylmuramic acid kinase
MSGSSLDGLDIVFAELLHEAGRWSFEIKAAECYPYSEEWRYKLQEATTLTALDYQLLHTAYGHYIGEQVNRFIDEHQLHYQAALVASHGHTTFHLPAQRMTAQLGDGAAIAAQTKLPVVSDLRALDIAFGGQGAPIVPIGEQLLLPEYALFLNLGGIANISFHQNSAFHAYDVCPANRVLNLLCAPVQKEYDAGGAMAAMGQVNDEMLRSLNELSYYKQAFPKSLANSFGTEEILPLVRSFGLTHNDNLRTYVEHIVVQLRKALDLEGLPANRRLLVTGGGAFNSFLIQRLTEELLELNMEVVVPDEQLVQYKEALVMALIGVLRWRQEYNVLSSVTGAERDSIGGAVWIGQEG